MALVVMLGVAVLAPKLLVAVVVLYVTIGSLYVVLWIWRHML